MDTIFDVGSSHACVQFNDELECWGDNAYGQVEIPHSITKVESVFTGARHTCADTPVL